MDSNSFSVLLAIYKNDNPKYFHLAMESIWDKQTLKPNEIILVADGQLTASLTNAIQIWQQKLEALLKVIQLEKNVGLANALNKGLNYCSYELIARMDVDDISLPNRFEKQIEFMQKNQQFAVLSSWVEEFDLDMEFSLGVRKVPNSKDEITQFAKRRNPINHPAAMFRKTAILAVGGYPIFRKAQDYALWSLLLRKGYLITNVQEVLLNMRTGQGLLNRRGASYFKHEIAILRFQKQIGFLSLYDFIINLFIRAFFRLQPNFLKEFLYKIIKNK